MSQRQVFGSLSQSLGGLPAEVGPAIAFPCDFEWDASKVNVTRWQGDPDGITLGCVQIFKRPDETIGEGSDLAGRTFPISRRVRYQVFVERRGDDVSIAQVESHDGHQGGETVRSGFSLVRFLRPMRRTEVRSSTARKGPLAVR